MNTNATIARERMNSEFFPATEQPRENSSGFRSTSLTTVSVYQRLAFDELIAGGRAAARHQLSIAKARRFFSDADASKAVAEAEAFASLVENQIRKLAMLPAVADLLIHMATDPARRSEHDPAPAWADALASRASALLSALNS